MKAIAEAAMTELLPSQPRRPSFRSAVVRPWRNLGVGLLLALAGACNDSIHLVGERGGAGAGSAPIAGTGGAAGAPATVGNPDTSAFPEVCSVDKWCWASPLPLGSTLSGHWGNGHELWIAGDGVSLHWDGTAWTAPPVPAGAQLTGVWGSAGNDVWAVGPSGVIHWDGATWKHSAEGALRDVWGSSGTDVWAVGAAGVMHWDGTSWSTTVILDHALSPPELAPVELRSVWGTGPDDVWAVGSIVTTTSPGFAGIAVHYDGKEWKIRRGGILFNYPQMRLVRGRGRDDVWIFADYDYPHHWNGNDWDTPAFPTGVTAAFSVGGTKDVFATSAEGFIRRWDGVSWSAPLSQVQPELVAGGFGGGSTGDLWAVGQGGVIEHWNGTVWSRVAPRWIATRENLIGVQGTSPTDVWAVSPAGSTLHGDGVAWTPVAPVPPTHVAAIGASADGRVFVAGSFSRIDGGALYQADANGSWSWLRLMSNPGPALNAIWGSPSGDMFLAGDAGLVMHAASGGNFVRAELPTTATGNLSSLWGTGPSDVWAAGKDQLLHFDGLSWSDARPCSCIGDNPHIWGSDANHVWIDGNLRWDGKAWSESGSPFGAVSAAWGRNGRALAMAPPKTAGSPVSAYNWNGAAWKIQAVPTSNVLHGAWSDEISSDWAVGESGTILRHHFAGP